MARIHRLSYISVESSIHGLRKSVNKFGCNPVSVPQVRGESCNIRLVSLAAVRHARGALGDDTKNGCEGD